MFIFLNKLKKDQSGQGLLYSAFILLVLVAFVLTVVDVGTVVNRKVQAQTAADAAAMSGAVVMARGLNVLSGLNLAIIACYGSIAFTLLAWGAACVGSLIPVINVVAGASCVVLGKIAPKAVEGLYKLAKSINRMQQALIPVFDVLISAEIYRIANKNLLNQDPEPFLLANAQVNNVNTIGDNIGNLVKNGAVGINGHLELFPRLSRVVERGQLKKLLKGVLPDWALQIKFKSNGKLKHKAYGKELKTIYGYKRLCPPRGLDKDGVVCNNCHRARYHTTKGCTLITQYNIWVKKKKTVKANLPSKDAWPMPYFLRSDWQQGVRICAASYRASSRKAISEPFFNKDKMIPWNLTMAEAMAYDWKPRKRTWLTNPTWRARMTPLTLHKNVIEKVSGTLPPKVIDKVNALGDNLLIH